jgi:hypothetical protein
MHIEAEPRIGQYFLKQNRNAHLRIESGRLGKGLVSLQLRKLGQNMV